MEQKPLLMVVTLNEVVKQHLCQKILDTIGHLIEVAGYSQDTKSFYERIPDLVVTAGPHCNSLAERFFPGVPYITAFRTLTGENLEQVLAIPTGKHVLVISNLKEIAQETIDLLQQVGINHIIYERYWIGKQIDATKYEYAIAPSVQHLCPYSFKHTIDLGIRSLNVRTFFQILEFFDLDLRYADAFENNYLKKHVATCQKVVRALNRSKELYRNQRATLDEVDEGIISVDQDGHLISYNRAAQSIFGVDADILDCEAFQRMAALLEKTPEEEERDFPGGLWRTGDIPVNIGGSEVLCRKSRITIHGKRQYLYILHPIEQIKRLGESARKKQYYHGLPVRYTFDDIWGDGPQSVHLREKAKTFSGTEQTILIVGESGTGKELLAQSIHQASPRRNGPFVGINLASMSQNLIESELFGYTEGAFTGAQKGGRPGLLEIADGGTVFLDEIGDAPLSIQVLLLRVLEERVITRVGGYQPIAINVRIVAATNRPLQEMVRRGTFRADLYYRLNVLSLQTIPLRDMSRDLIAFLGRYIQRLAKREIAFSGEVIRLLQQYGWPGNFRELKNLAEYLHYAYPSKSHITEGDLPEYLLAEMGRQTQPQQQSLQAFEQICQREPLLWKILSLLQSAKPAGIGRGTLSAMLASSGQCVSEGKLRHYMEQLKQSGLAYAGSTKQGTFITDQGSSFLSASGTLLHP